MQTTSGITNYDSIIAAGEYRSESKLVINNVDYTEESIMSLKTIRGVFEDNQFSIGNAFVGRIDATIRLKSNVTIPKAAEVKVYIRIFNATTTSGWLSKGVFYIYQREVNSDNTVMSFTGFDGMFKANAAYPSSTLEWSASSPSPRQVLNEIATTLGITLDNRTKNSIPLASAYVLNFPSQYNMREVLQSIAVIYMGNFCMSDTGELLFVGIADIAEPEPEPTVVTYTIYFMPNGTGVTGMISEDRVTGDNPNAGIMYTPDPSMIPQRDGYTFVQWNTEPDGSGIPCDPTASYPLNSIGINPNSSTTVYAIWQEVSTSYLVNEDGDAIVFGTDRILV